MTETSLKPALCFGEAVVALTLGFPIAADSFLSYSLAIIFCILLVCRDQACGATEVAVGAVLTCETADSLPPNDIKLFASERELGWGDI